MLKKFNLLCEEIIKEMNENSFYPAKYIDGTQAVGTDFNGNEQIWMIGPTNEHTTKDYITQQVLPWMTTILWLPNKFGYKQGLAISYDSYLESVNDPDIQAKLAELGLIKEIDWEAI